MKLVELSSNWLVHGLVASWSSSFRRMIFFFVNRFNIQNVLKYPQVLTHSICVCSFHHLLTSMKPNRTHINKTMYKSKKKQTKNKNIITQKLIQHTKENNNHIWEYEIRVFFLSLNLPHSLSLIFFLSYSLIQLLSLLFDSIQLNMKFISVGLVLFMHRNASVVQSTMLHKAEQQIVNELRLQEQTIAINTKLRKKNN